MKFKHFLYAFVVVSAVKTVDADIRDFIITEEEAFSQMSHEIDLSDGDDDDENYGYDMAEYDSCGGYEHETPAQKYLHNSAEETLKSDYDPEVMTRGNAMKILQYMLKEQKTSLNYFQDLFTQLSSNPKYKEIFEQVMAEESYDAFDAESSCSQSPAIDVFTSNNGFANADFAY